MKILFEGQEGRIILLTFSCGGTFNVGGPDLVELVLFTILWLQIPRNGSLPISHIYNTSNRRYILNPVEHLQWNFLEETVNVLRSLATLAE